tara:strand:- start:1819 stop:2508 length:690 start_codon:yes stop_codon:yes gene_type:complete
MGTTFWLNDPKILIQQEHIFKIWPDREMNTNDKLNAITRLIIILTVLGFLITQTYKILITGIVTLGCIVILKQAHFWKSTKEDIKKAGKEAFSNPDYYKMMRKNFTEPTINNPAMNVLLPQISDDPHRKAAAPAFNPVVEKDINKATQKFVTSNFDNDPDIADKLFKDLGDNYIFNNSMWNWYATPNTKIPNDQGAFAEYCYGDMISCKENNGLACMQDMPPHWINGTN